MQKKVSCLLFSIFSVLILSRTINAQTPLVDSRKNGEVRGKVIDSVSKDPIEYANVAIYSTKDSVLVNGAASAHSGAFIVNNLDEGSYFLKVKFLGFTPRVLSGIAINADKSILRIGDILLEPDISVLNDVEVVGEGNEFTVHLDKRIITVNQKIEAAGGTAADVLRDAPSVRVTPDGNVSLRGSTSFQVLIDGRLSPLTGSEALNSIPAGNIQKVEIITNPSAKYDPNGLGGIINVITRRKRLTGFDGNVMVGSDHLGGYVSNVLFNYNSGKVTFFAGFDHNKRVSEGDIVKEISKKDSPLFFKQEGEQEAWKRNTGMRSGVEYRISKTDNLIFMLNLGSWDTENHGNYSVKTFEADLETVDVHSDLNRKDGDYGSVDLGYQHRFAETGQVLDFSAQWKYKKYDNLIQNQMFAESGELINTINSNDANDRNDYLLKIDYTYPVGESGKFETGYQYTHENEALTYQSDLSGFDLMQADNPTVLSDEGELSRNIHSVYAIYGGEGDKIGYQFGLRSEYSERTVQMGLQSDVDREKWDFFPSVHLSYQLGNNQELVAAFSRRINRQKASYLSPFSIWYDFYNVRAGNPDLKNEYSNSATLTYQKKFQRNYLMLEAYYDQTQNKVERYRSMLTEPVLQEQYMNVGDGRMIGVDGSLRLQMKRWWVMKQILDFYHYQQDGTVAGNYYKRDEYSWSAQLTNLFILSKNTQMQLGFTYASPTISSQGEIDDFYYANLTLRQYFLKRKLSLTLTGQDILQSVKSESTITGDGFTHRNVLEHHYPIRFVVSYKINNYKRDHRKAELKNFLED